VTVGSVDATSATSIFSWVRFRSLSAPGGEELCLTEWFDPIRRTEAWVQIGTQNDGALGAIGNIIPPPSQVAGTRAASLTILVAVPAVDEYYGFASATFDARGVAFASNDIPGLKVPRRVSGEFLRSGTNSIPVGDWFASSALRTVYLVQLYGDSTVWVGEYSDAGQLRQSRWLQFSSEELDALRAEVPPGTPELVDSLDPAGEARQRDIARERDAGEIRIFRSVMLDESTGRATLGSVNEHDLPGMEFWSENLGMQGSTDQGGGEDLRALSHFLDGRLADSVMIGKRTGTIYQWDRTWQLPELPWGDAGLAHFWEWDDDEKRGIGHSGPIILQESGGIHFGGCKPTRVDGEPPGAGPVFLFWLEHGRFDPEVGLPDDVFGVVGEGASSLLLYEAEYDADGVFAAGSKGAPKRLKPIDTRFQSAPDEVARRANLVGIGLVLLPEARDRLRLTIFDANGVPQLDETYRYPLPRFKWANPKIAAGAL